MSAVRESIQKHTCPFSAQYDTIPRSGDAKRRLIKIRTKFALDYGNKIGLRKVSNKNINLNSSKTTR